VQYDILQKVQSLISENIWFVAPLKLDFGRRAGAPDGIYQGHSQIDGLAPE